MTHRIAFAACTAGWFLFLFVLGHAQQVGEPLPPWSAGTLEIHQISTGRGNSALLIFPDGTSLMVDAGDLDRGGVTTQRPNASRNAGEWIARYAKRMLAHDPNPSIDYALMTHFHPDHIGGPRLESRRSRGGYRVSGISEVAEHLPVRTLLDRAWPEYNYPATVARIENYRAFLDWQQQNVGLVVQRFRPGRNDQIRLQRDPGRFPTFEVRNIAANGEVWTGLGTTTRQMFPRPEDLSVDDYPTENSCSTVIRVSYGKFDYLSGGDLPGAPDPTGGPRWTDMETAIAPVVGPIDVLLVNHHGMYNASNEVFLKSLRPRVLVMSSNSGPLTPDFGVVDRLLSTRIFSGPRDVFATGVLAPMRAVLGERLKQFRSTQGHVVVRVDSDGETFRVFVLDDSAENFVVTAVHGPYQAR
jgi:beta-lactamase superfamily II metal-dependent hydrolase